MLSKLPQDNKFYLESLQIALNILKACPPEDCVPIGLGRSPSSVMAALSILSDDIYGLPLSNFRYNLKENGALPHRHLPEKYEERFSKHLKRFLPTQDVLKGRRVLLIDYSLGGSSLFSAETYIRTYFNKIKQVTHIASFMMLRRYPDNLEIVRKVAIDQYKIKNFTAFDMTDFPTVDKHLLQSDLDPFSKYGPYDLKINLFVGKNLKHHLLVSRMRSVLSKDKELQQRFAERLGITMVQLAARISRVRNNCARLLSFLF